MFDSVTSALITSAPQLSGVDHERLPSMITDAYVQVEISRSLLGKQPTESDSILEELRSIGATQEAIALAIDDREVQSSAAFVAASAYRILAEAYPTTELGGQLLHCDSIAPQVASMLLYLVADATADSSEAASNFNAATSDPYGRLVETLSRLGRGDFNSSETHSPMVLNLNAIPSELAADIGYRECETLLIKFFTAMTDSDAIGIWESGRFAKIADSMERETTFHSPDGPRVTTNLIAGPWHLARLLDMAEPVLLQTSVVATSPPRNVEDTEWKHTISRIARSRPLLWRNHRSALDDGLLNEGVSAVLSFPTGAGKSTLTELKIAAAVLRNRNVICLAPTLSLVDQLARSFRRSIPEAIVTAQKDVDEELPSIQDGRPEVFVMTPESCFSVLGIDHERFGDVGLVIFDEAHLMHVEGQEPSRRSLDATLCFLTLASRFPQADLLLVSAMISNTAELTGWIESMTGRSALALDNPWKPTRQARGALVYDSEDLQRLREHLRAAFLAVPNKTVPVEVRREMRAEPYGFFSLKPTWESTQKRDYRLVSLLNEPVELAVGGHRTRDGHWWLTSNANKVAAKLAGSAAKFGMKTLIFTHQIDWTVSTARNVPSTTTRRTALVDQELRLVSKIVDALGDQSAMYIDVEDAEVVGEAIPHHGLLLPEERRLHERLYQRSDGIPVMVATSTVTQGMNFPSEFVIIASDRRYDPQVESRARLETHELLNAAGRAGRAGSHSNALVLVIPGNLVEYDSRASRIGSAWSPLRDSFSKSDQCVELRDPLGPLLDSLDSDLDSPLLDYLFRRVDSITSTTLGPQMLRRSFAAYSAGRNGSDEWIDQRISQLSEVIETESAEPWVRQCSLVSGMPLRDVVFVADRLESALGLHDTFAEWARWVLDLLRDRPEMAERVLRIGSRAALAGTADELDPWSSSGDTLIRHLRVLLPLWLNGKPLAKIQDKGIELGLARRTDQQFAFARKFVLRVIPDLSYLFALPGIIQSQRALFQDRNELPEEHPLGYLSKCVELGVDSLAKIRLLESDPDSTRTQLASPSE